MKEKGRRSQTSKLARSGDACRSKKTVDTVGEEILTVLQKGIDEGKLWCKHYINQVRGVVRDRKEFTKEFLRELYERVNGGGKCFLDTEYFTFCDLADAFNSLLKPGRSRNVRRRVQIV